MDPHDVLRVVEVDPTTGGQRLGEVADPLVASWVEQWWPLDGPGHRADVGLPRDDWWAEQVAGWAPTVCIAVDYGHVGTDRPAGSTLASYRRGRAYEPIFDGRHDVTAHVAVDSTADRVGAELTTQRALLRSFGLTADRPPVDLASTDPLGYVRLLSRAGQVAELTETPGLGDFWWIVTGPPVGA